jgi:hypothetical protein
MYVILGFPAKVILSIPAGSLALLAKCAQNVLTTETEPNPLMACGLEKSQRKRTTMAKNKYESDIILGDKYRDEQTGIEGVATAIYFFQHACERVCLEFVHPQRGLTEHTFDSPRLMHIPTRRVAQSERPGGPEREVGVRPTGGAR